MPVKPNPKHPVTDDRRELGGGVVIQVESKVSWERERMNSGSVTEIEMGEKSNGRELEREARKKEGTGAQCRLRARIVGRRGPSGFSKFKYGERTIILNKKTWSEGRSKVENFGNQWWGFEGKVFSMRILNTTEKIKSAEQGWKH